MTGLPFDTTRHNGSNGGRTLSASPRARQSSFCPKIPMFDECPGATFFSG
jgi:hypothetical protein